MKRILYFSKIIIILLTSSNCEHAQQSPDPPIDINIQQLPDSPIDIAITKNQINVCVKPQVELISIIQTIGEYPSILGFLMSKDPSDYKTDVMNHFTSYQDHPAVLMFDRLSSQPRMLNFSAPSNIMLYINSDLRLREDIELDSFVISRIGGRDSLLVFLDLLHDFAIQSSFNEFYNNHYGYYLEIIEKTINNLGSIDYVSELEDFYGIKQESYSIVLVSLYGFVGFGNSLLCPNNQRELYNTMGPQKVEGNIPSFGSENYLKYMIRHEFSHPYINPLTEKHWDYIKDYSDNYDTIPEIAKNQMCGDWQEYINESVIRAITTQLAYNESSETGTRAYKEEISRGVSNLDYLIKKIGYYQSNRDTYPTFESYYLKMLDAFKGE